MPKSLLNQDWRSAKHDERGMGDVSKAQDAVCSKMFKFGANLVVLPTSAEALIERKRQSARSRLGEIISSCAKINADLRLDSIDCKRMPVSGSKKRL